MSRPADADPISRRDVRLSREQAFYDELARGIDPEALPPSAPDVGERALLEALAPVAGRRVLDAGCGTGDLTLQLLAVGAKVTALDISPRMVELVRARAERFRPGADVRFVAAPVENTRLPDAAFEAVVGKWVLHYSDFPLAARELARVLVARGRGPSSRIRGSTP